MDAEKIEQLKKPENRVLYLSGPVGLETGNIITRQLEALAQASEDDIMMIINSPGGAVSSMLMITECMDNLPNDIVTMVVGQAASAAAFIGACGTPGKRLATTNSRFMYHMARGGFDVAGEQTEKFVRTVRETMDQHMARVTGHTLEAIPEKTRLELFLTAEEAIAFGALDRIIE